MKRRAVKLVVFLLLGAIVNIAVAWGLGVTTEFHRANVNDDVLRAAHRLWRNAGPSTWPRDPSVSYFVCDIGVLKVGMHQPAQATAGVWNHRIDWFMSGWPAYGMQGHRISQTGLAGGFSRNSGVLLFFDAPINLWPLWPGFAINTIVYATILWMLFFTPGALRRHRRIKRGQCPACAYPVGTSPVCTECGNPVQPRRGDGL